IASMADAVTMPTGVSVTDFIGAVEPPARREEACVLDALFRRVTGVEPQMWGPTIIGYGDYRTVYASGREVHNLRCGLPRARPSTRCISWRAAMVRSKLRSPRLLRGWASTRVARRVSTSTNYPTWISPCWRRW